MASDTPPMGTTIPQPKVEEPLPPPPRVPNIQDVYRLIDERLPIAIPIKVVERFSSAPPPPPKQSLFARGVKGSSKWYAYVIAAAVSLAQIIASAALPEYRGPIVQAGKLIMVVVSELLAEDPAALPDRDTPELLPEPWAPLPTEPE